MTTIASTPPQMIPRRKYREVRKHAAPLRDPLEPIPSILRPPEGPDTAVRAGFGGLGVDGPGCQLSPSSHPASSSSSSSSQPPEPDLVACVPCELSPWWWWVEPWDPADPCEPREDDLPRDIGPDAAWDPVEPCETRGAMGLASSASQPSVAAMVLSYLITRGSKNRKK
jgi:hypothetical protein